MEEKPPDISNQDLDAILKYLQVFGEPSFSSGVLKQEPGYLPYYQYDSRVDSFVHDLHEHGFIFSFDWPSWQEEAIRLFENPETIAHADLITIQKMFTTHVRKDRFCEGHLAAMIESGHMTAILQRLKQIRDSRIKSSSSQK